MASGRPLTGLAEVPGTIHMSNILTIFEVWVRDIPSCQNLKFQITSNIMSCRVDLKNKKIVPF